MSGDVLKEGTEGNILVQGEEDRRKLHSEELRNLYPLLGIAGEIILTVTRPKRYVARKRGRKRVWDFNE